MKKLKVTWINYPLKIIKYSFCVKKKTIITVWIKLLPKYMVVWWNLSANYVIMNSFLICGTDNASWHYLIICNYKALEYKNSMTDGSSVWKEVWSWEVKLKEWVWFTDDQLQIGDTNHPMTTPKWFSLLYEFR